MFLSSLKLRVSYSDILGDTSHLLSCSFPSHSCSPSIHHTSVLAPCSLQGQSAQADWLTALSSKPLQEAALRTRAMFSAWNSDLSAVIQISEQNLHPLPCCHLPLGSWWSSGGREVAQLGECCKGWHWPQGLHTSSQRRNLHSIWVIES